MTDPFQDIREQERIQLARLEADIASQAAALEMAHKASMLSGQAGFAEFMKALDDVLSVATKKLTFDRLSDQDLREQRGRVMAFHEVRRLVRPAPETVQQLARQLEVLQNAHQEALKRIPKPRGTPT